VPRGIGPRGSRVRSDLCSNVASTLAAIASGTHSASGKRCEADLARGIPPSPSVCRVTLRLSREYLNDAVLSQRPYSIRLPRSFSGLARTRSDRLSWSSQAAIADRSVRHRATAKRRYRSRWQSNLSIRASSTTSRRTCRSGDRCRGAPRTKLALRRRRSPRSCRPGRSRPCSRNRYPRARTGEEKARSDVVPLPRMRAIRADRSAGVKTSLRRGPLALMGPRPLDKTSGTC